MPQNIDWKILKPAIQNNRCVLFLGPDAYPFNAEGTVEANMWEKTASDASLVRHLYRDDGLVLFQKNTYRGAFLETVRVFYDDQSKDWSLTNLQLQKLVHLPFRAIINLTFDDLLKQHFDENGLECQLMHYVFRPSTTEKLISTLPIDAHKPLIINLLGSIRSSDNLVLTHNDLYDFLRSLFDDKDMWLKELLYETDCFLFIGAPFEKWYLQLLLQKISEYKRSQGEAERYALPEQKAIPMQELYSHELRIQFVEEEQQAVIEELYRYCEDKKLLLQPKIPKQFYQNQFLQKIHRHLLRGEVNNAIDLAILFPTEQRFLIEQITLISARHHIWQDSDNQINQADRNIEKNRIIKSLLDWLSEADGIKVDSNLA